MDNGRNVHPYLEGVKHRFVLGTSLETRKYIYNYHCILMDFSVERSKYKGLKQKKINGILSLSYIEDFVKIYGLNNYKFVLANGEHIESTLNLISKTYWLHNVFPTIFDMKREDVMNVMRETVIRRIQNRGFILAIDKHNGKIVACVGCEDIYDEPSIFYAKAKPSPGTAAEHVYVFELLNIVNVKRSKLESLSNGKYGVVCHGGSVAKDSDDKNTPFLSFFITMLSSILLYECGYQYYYGEVTHLGAKKMIQRMNPNQKLDEVDFSNFTFKDGTNISVYFNALKTKKKMNDNQVEKLKKRCKLYSVLIDKNALKLSAKVIKNMAQKRKKIGLISKL